MQLKRVSPKLQEDEMEEALLRMKIKREQSETVMRWIAMSIVTTPDQLRPAKCLRVRDAITDAVIHEGAKGADTDHCVSERVEAIFRIARELEARGISPSAAGSSPDMSTT
jgi:hypothetical protein